MTKPTESTATQPPKHDPILIITTALRQTAESVQERIKAGRLDIRDGSIAQALFNLADEIPKVVKQFDMELIDDEDDEVEDGQVEEDDE